MPANEIEDANRANPCDIPPAGWWCSREGGHEGPCAARQEPDNANKAGRLWYKRWWSAQQEITRLNAALESLTDTRGEDMRALLAAIDAWTNDPCPATEQGIMDARTALSSIEYEGKSNG